MSPHLGDVLPSVGMFQVFTFDLLEPTKAHLEVVGGPASEVLLEACDCANALSPPHHVKAGQPVDVELGTCRWLVTLVTRQTQPIRVELMLTKVD